MLGFLALLGALTVAAPCETGVCSCVGRRDVQSALRNADAVFTGRVVSVRNPRPWWRRDPDPQRRVTLRVDRAWKGVDSRTVVMIMGLSSSCEFQFRRGESYLVFAYRRQNGALGTSICSRTETIDRAAAAVRDLGPPTRDW